MKISAVFLDRDGVLNPHIPGGYLLSADDAVLLPGVAPSVRRLNQAGLPVVVISNQQGIGKGEMTREDLMGIQQRMAELLRQEGDARIDRYYYSTELASENSSRRKPAPGMLIEAADDLALPLSNIVFAGDSATDIQAGQAAGVGAAILLLSGSIPSYHLGEISPAPDFVFATLSAAVDWILEQQK